MQAGLRQGQPGMFTDFARRGGSGAFSALYFASGDCDNAGNPCRYRRGQRPSRFPIEPSSTLAPLRAYPVFRRLWLASQLSNIGGLIQAVGAGWLMTSLSSSKGMVALVQASNTLPMMVLALVAGALADNYDRRRIMLGAQLFMLAVSVALAVIARADLLTPWLLLTFTFLIGCGGAVYNPSWQASMGDIVPRADLPGAVSLNSMGFNLARSIGPAIGGAIVVAAGAAVAFGINAASYVALIVVLWRWRPALPAASLPREPVLSAVGAGLRYMSMSPHLIRIMARGGWFGFAASSVMALLPVVARDLLGGTALTYGILLGFFGAGAIGGVFLNARLRSRLDNEHIVRLAFAGFALGAAILGTSRNLPLSALGLLPAGAAWVLALSLFNVSVQLSSPRWVVGRALSFYQTATFGGMAAGAWLWGTQADLHGPVAALLTAAGVLVAGALVGRWLPVPQFATQDLAPLGRFVAPALGLDLRPSSGPIMIMVAYRIDAADTDAFLALMQRRRRIRIRDGARQWALLRDLEDPDIWSETYHVATWVDYLRHHERRTKADGDVSDGIFALHRGGAPPHVRRMIERQTVPLHEDLARKLAPELE